MSRASHQRIITIALEVLDRAAYASSTQRVDTLDVRLALAVLWMFVRDRSGLEAFWERAGRGRTHAWEGCREHYWAVAKALRDEGWDAPPIRRHDPI